MYGLLNWLPTFFKDYYQVEIADLASYTLLPYIVQGGLGAASGVLAGKFCGCFMGMLCVIGYKQKGLCLQNRHRAVQGHYGMDIAHGLQVIIEQVIAAFSLAA
jgi:hypothetical protein